MHTTLFSNFIIYLSNSFLGAVTSNAFGNEGLHGNTNKYLWRNFPKQYTMLIVLKYKFVLSDVPSYYNLKWIFYESTPFLNIALLS